ncbi:hypothetical protein HZH66_008286 [Vespula vulgaris]|uniref:Uncharacterized protein n=1 Tax=Vespula vulgaris TaxID=7454 RepID=A0A834JWS0_VESVU|nr:hypothetical protein HZH66_008286 [Vespula vulgaris]
MSPGNIQFCEISTNEIPRGRFGIDCHGKCSGNLWNDLKWHVVVFEKERVPTRDIEMEVTWLHENAAIPNSSNLSLDYMQGQFCASSYRDKIKETKLKTNE